MRVCVCMCVVWCVCVCVYVCVCRVYTHHYEQYMDLSTFHEASEIMCDITRRYADTDKQADTNPDTATRLRSRGIRFC